MKLKLQFCIALFFTLFFATAATKFSNTNQPPSATISYNSPFCQSSTLETVTLTGTTGGAFLASPTGLFIDATSGNIYPNQSTPGTYAVTYAITNFSVTTTVTINAQPEAGIDGFLPFVCETSTTTLNLFSLITGEQPGGTWTRVLGTGGTFNASAGTFTPAMGATTSSFVYTILGLLPCIDDSSVATVSITSQPDAGIGGSINVSSTTNAVIDLFSLIFGEQPGGTWTRISGAGGTFNATLGSFNPYPDATSSTFIYTLVGVSPCTDASSGATITTSSIVIPQFSVIAALCSGSVPPILPLVSTNGISGTWTPPSIDNTQSTTYIFTPDVGQSADVVSLTVQVIPSPTATIIVPDTVIIGSPYVVGFTGTPNAIISYQFNGGPNQIIVLNNAGQATIFFENAIASTICLISAEGVCTTPLVGCATVNIVPVPAPIGNPMQTFAQGATLADIIVTGTNVQWYDGANRNVNSNPLPMSTVLVNGATYYASQTSNGYESPDRLAVTVQVTLVTNPFDFTNLTYSPNPIENILNINSREAFRNVRIYNYLGQIVYQQLSETSNLKLDLGFLTKGNYFIKLESDNKSQVIKVIKE